jgi:methionine sulfoxide reductase heme-binding subunit
MAAERFKSFNAALRRLPRFVVYVLGFCPAAWLFWLGLEDRLGPEPVRALEHGLGLWALRFLLAALAVTPLRRLARIDLLRFRRALGLLAFYYAALHVAAYAAIDMGLSFDAVIADIVKRPYLTIGMAGFALLAPLALTSNDWSIRRMGAPAWRKLHRLAYVAALAGAAHFLLAVKSLPAEPAIYAAVTALLLFYRLIGGSRLGGHTARPA